jgi:hypothetical protein
MAKELVRVVPGEASRFRRSGFGPGLASFARPGLGLSRCYPRLTRWAVFCCRFAARIEFFAFWGAMRRLVTNQR